MFGISFSELLLVGLVALLVLGPERLPGAARTAGLWIGRLKRSFNSIRTEIERELGADEIRRQLHNEHIVSLEQEARKLIDPNGNHPPPSIHAPTAPAPTAAPPMGQPTEPRMAPPSGSPLIDGAPAGVGASQPTSQQAGPRQAEPSQDEPRQAGPRQADAAVPPAEPVPRNPRPHQDPTSAP